MRDKFGRSSKWAAILNYECRRPFLGGGTRSGKVILAALLTPTPTVGHAEAAPTVAECQTSNWGVAGCTSQWAEKICADFEPALLALDEPAIRRSTRMLEANPNQLSGLRCAVARMKARDDSKDILEFRRSWRYWANVHGYYTKDTFDGQTAKAIAGLRSKYQQRRSSTGLEYIAAAEKARIESPNPEEVDAWGQCVHINDKFAPESEPNIYFLIWHRIFIYALENQLKLAAGSPNVTLPYWDYTSPIDGARAIPESFSTKEIKLRDGLSVPNPLWSPLRIIAAKVENGLRPPEVVGESAIEGVDSLLSEAKFLEFQFKLATTIHNAIHAGITGRYANVPGMGDIPYAANDPIFYAHHANIDRLWSCWSRRHHEDSAMPDAQLENTYKMINSDGGFVYYDAKDSLNGGRLNGKYDADSECDFGHKKDGNGFNYFPSAEGARWVEHRCTAGIDLPLLRKVRPQGIQIAKNVSGMGLDIMLSSAQLAKLKKRCAPDVSQDSLKTARYRVLAEVRASNLDLLTSEVGLSVAPKDGQKPFKRIATVYRIGTHDHHVHQGEILIRFDSSALVPEGYTKIGRGIILRIAPVRPVGVTDKMQSKEVGRFVRRLKSVKLELRVFSKGGEIRQ